MTWELVKSEGRTIYHRRTLNTWAWLTVVQVDTHRWEWAVREWPDDQTVPTVLAAGEATSWLYARRYADRAAGRLEIPIDAYLERDDDR